MTLIMDRIATAASYENMKANTTSLLSNVLLHQQQQQTQQQQQQHQMHLQQFQHHQGPDSLQATPDLQEDIKPNLSGLAGWSNSDFDTKSSCLFNRLQQQPPAGNGNSARGAMCNFNSPSSSPGLEQFGL